jgi:hypothetical protein
MKRSVGTVFHYPYFWYDDYKNGIENPKNRTTTISIIKKTINNNSAELTHLFLLGITDSPREGQDCIEIPALEKRRAGLDPLRLAYVVVSEYNYDLLPHSYDYDPNSKDFGVFSDVFINTVRDKFIAALRQKQSIRMQRR